MKLANRISSRLVAPLALATAFLCATPAAAQTVNGTVVLREGDMPMGAAGTVTELDHAFVNGMNQVGFTGTAGNEEFVWVNNAVVFTASDEQNVTITRGNPDAFGLSDLGAWVFNPTVDGVTSVYGDQGLLYTEGDVSPLVTNGVMNFLYSGRMVPNGDVYFVASVDTDNDNITEVRALYHLPGGTTQNPAILLQSGDTVSNETILTNSPAGIDDDEWDISNNGMHYSAEVFIAATQADDNVIVVDGAIVMREGSTTGGNDNWEGFSLNEINDNGDYVVGGVTDGPGASNQFLAFNGAIALREGDTFNGITYGGQGNAVWAAEINNNGHVAFVWNEGQVETLFLTCDNTDFPNSTVILAQVGDGIDVDNDQVDDYTLTDFNMTAPIQQAQFNRHGIALSNDGFVYLNVDTDDGNGTAETILQLEAACCGDMIIGGNEECDDGMESTACNVDCTMTVCGDDKINVTAGEECEIGTGGETAVCDADCTFPMCGDGVHNVSAGEECDDGMESATCDSDCTPAACGDGLLNNAAGEQCEDGNTDDGDGCSSTCQTEGGGTGGGSGSGTGGGSGTGTGTGTGGAAAAPGAAEDDGGCGCTTPGKSNDNAPLGLAALSLLGLGLVRRRRG